jgi:hypothetical protein
MKYILLPTVSPAFALNANVHHEVNVPEISVHYQPYELALSSKLVDMVKLYKIEILYA